MDMLSHFEIYIAAQKNVANQFMLIGASLIILAVLFHFFGKGDLSAGLRTGVLVCGVFILFGGIAYRNTENKLLETATLLHQKNTAEFQQQETERMQKVIKDYPIYQIVFGSFIILSLLVVWFVKSPFWHGVAFSIIILFIPVMIVEAYSHQSIKAYFKHLTE